LIDVEATPARTFGEVAATPVMIDRTERTFDLKPKRLIADTAYGNRPLPRAPLSNGQPFTPSRTFRLEPARSVILQTGRNAED
jgi:hypothetical protein